MRSQTRLAWFLARRYLASRSGGRFLSFITWIALGGVTIGVTALVVVIGVMTGMQNELRARILGSTPHIMVWKDASPLRVDDWERVVAKVESVTGVVSAAPVVWTQVGVDHDGYPQVMRLFGVDLDARGVPVTDMEDSLRSGNLPLEREAGGPTPFVLGSGLARQMNLFTDDTVSVVAIENVRVGPNGELIPRTEEWVVSGIFSTGMHEYDMTNGYAAMGAVQNLLDLDEGVVTWVGVRTHDPWDAEAVARAVLDTLGGMPYRADPWTRTNQQLFSALKLEKLAMGVIVSLIILVAACNIVGTLVMVVVNRTREIGILKAMGLTRRDTLRTFIFQGLWIGVIGTVSGLALGFILAFLIEEYRLIPIPPDIYFVDRLPVSISPSDILWISGVSLLISLLATIHPARQASRLQPVEAIRHE